MLSYPRHRTATDVDLDSIHNYYEAIVLDKVSGLANDADFDPNLIPDIACVALNHLPPRYIRHDVDMAFYLSPSEYDEIEHKIDTAITRAIAFVLEREAPADADTETDNTEEQAPKSRAEDELE